jgi:hypothetical protein
MMDLLRSPFCSAAAHTLLLVASIDHASAFMHPHHTITTQRNNNVVVQHQYHHTSYVLYSSLKDKTDDETSTSSADSTPFFVNVKSSQEDSSTSSVTKPKPVEGIEVNNQKDSTTVVVKAPAGTSSSSVEPKINPDAEGLPWWWELVWKLDIMKTGDPGKEIIFGDTANVLRTNIEQIYGGYPSLDGCPLAEGEITDIADGTMFLGLQRYFEGYGSPYKLCFGPKSFLVVSDPIQAKHILKDANTNYDKVRCV